MVKTYILQGSEKLAPFVTQIQSQIDQTLSKIEAVIPLSDFF